MTSKKKHKVEGLILSDFKTYYEVIVRKDDTGKSIHIQIIEQNQKSRIRAMYLW